MSSSTRSSRLVDKGEPLGIDAVMTTQAMAMTGSYFHIGILGLTTGG